MVTIILISLICATSSDVFTRTKLSAVRCVVCMKSATSRLCEKADRHIYNISRIESTASKQYFVRLVIRA